MAARRQALLRVARQNASWASLLGSGRQASTISAAVAAETSRRSLGSLELPRDVTDAINQAAKGGWMAPGRGGDGGQKALCLEWVPIREEPLARRARLSPDTSPPDTPRLSWCIAQV